MGRLIDADALKETVRKKYKDLPSRCEINELVNAAPTIPAIPVEWLEDKELYYRTTGDKLFSDAFAVVIGEWPKEQEAR